MTELDFLEAQWGGVDDDGIGRLTVRACAGGFAGIGSAWLSEDGVLEFSERIKAYPLDDDHPSIDGGYRTEDRSGVHLSLRVYPIGKLGQLGVIVELASDILKIKDPARQSRARFELLTSYEAVRRFSEQLRGIVAGTSDVARLDSERLE